MGALSRGGLSVLLEVVVEDLGVRLLVWCQDVHEWGRWVGSGCGRVDGTSGSQRRGQVEGSGRGGGVESLLLKRLLCLGIDRAGYIGDTSITGGDRHTGVVSMRAVAGRLLEGASRSIDPNIHPVLLRCGRRHWEHGAVLESAG